MLEFSLDSDPFWHPLEPHRDNPYECSPEKPLRLQSFIEKSLRDHWLEIFRKKLPVPPKFPPGFGIDGQEEEGQEQDEEDVDEDSVEYSDGSVDEDDDDDSDEDDEKSVWDVWMETRRYQRPVPPKHPPRYVIVVPGWFPRPDEQEQGDDGGDNSNEEDDEEDDEKDDEKSGDVRMKLIDGQWIWILPPKNGKGGGEDERRKLRSDVGDQGEDGPSSDSGIVIPYPLALLPAGSVPPLPYVDTEMTEVTVSAVLQLGTHQVFSNNITLFYDSPIVRASFAIVAVSGSDLTVRYNATSSVGSIVGYDWDFGDGSFGHDGEAIDTHVYHNATYGSGEMLFPSLRVIDRHNSTAFGHYELLL